MWSLIISTNYEITINQRFRLRKKKNSKGKQPGCQVEHSVTPPFHSPESPSNTPETSWPQVNKRWNDGRCLSTHAQWQQPKCKQTFKKKKKKKTMRTSQRTSQRLPPDQYERQINSSWSGDQSVTWGRVAHEQDSSKMGYRHSHMKKSEFLNSSKTNTRSSATIAPWLKIQLNICGDYA